MMEGSSAVRIDRKSSIEKEPRTLNINQIQYAREAALYVLSTRSIEDAMKIFMEGLEPVESVSTKNEKRMVELREELDHFLEDQLQTSVLRDVASAPF